MESMRRRSERKDELCGAGVFSLNELPLFIECLKAWVLGIERERTPQFGRTGVCAVIDLHQQKLAVKRGGIVGRKLERPCESIASALPIADLQREQSGIVPAADVLRLELEERVIG